MRVRLMQWRDRHGEHRCVLVAEGRRWLNTLPVDAGGLRVRRLRREEGRYMRPMPDYPLRRAVRHYRAVASQCGATKRALALLAAAEKEAATEGLRL